MQIKIMLKNRLKRRYLFICNVREFRDYYFQFIISLCIFHIFFNMTLSEDLNN